MYNTSNIKRILYGDGKKKLYMNQDYFLSQGYIRLKEYNSFCLIKPIDWMEILFSFHLRNLFIIYLILVIIKNGHCQRKCPLFRY